MMQFWDYPISGDTAEHAAYGVGPATDFETPIGVPVSAPFSGSTVLYSTTEGGQGFRLIGDAFTLVAQHMSSLEAPVQYATGDTVAHSGNSGRNILNPSVPYGPHVHCYIIVNATGERISFTEWRARYDPTLPGDPATIESEDEMAMRIISCPAYAAAGQVAISDGYSFQTVPKGWVVNMALYGRVPIIDYPDNEAFMQEIRVFYYMKGLSDKALSEKLNEVIGGILKPSS